MEEITETVTCNTESFEEKRMEKDTFEYQSHLDHDATYRPWQKSKVDALGAEGVNSWVKRLELFIRYSFNISNLTMLAVMHCRLARESNRLFKLQWTLAEDHKELLSQFEEKRNLLAGKSASYAYILGVRHIYIKRLEDRVQEAENKVSDLGTQLLI